MNPDLNLKLLLKLNLSNSNTWKIIEKERVEGFEHRNSKKRINKMEVTNDENSTNKIIHNMQSNTNICLIKLDDIELEDDSPE